MDGSTQKCTVRHKNARFDIKMPSPACIIWNCRYSQPTPTPTPPTPLLWEIFFTNFIQIFIKEPIEKRKWNYIDMNSNILNIIMEFEMYLFFLFVITIMSAAINECYRYCWIFCQFLHFLLIDPLKSDTHVELIAGSIMHSKRTFVITVSNDRVSCRPHLEEKLLTLLPL